MLEVMKQEANLTYTENRAVTLESTGSHCLDLFATAGALRTAADEEIIVRFLRAYTEQPDLAMKLLFYTRDIRGGLGERRVFRVILAWLAEHEPAAVMKNISYIAEYGRFDDLLMLLDTGCGKTAEAYLREQFFRDLEQLEKGEQVSLLGKWLPSVNASNPQTKRCAKKLCRAFGMTDADYRKALVKLRAKIRIIENNLREKDYSFSYEKQPSRALYKYRKAFMRNDEERYNDFLVKVQSGKKQLNASNIAPYELVEPYLSGWDRRGRLESMTEEEKSVLNTTWASLPDYGSDENMLAVIDTSGSMYGGKPLPAAVALSMGIYLAEHNRGRFHDHFIEFSRRPQLIELKGDNFAERLRYIASFAEIANTNLEAVFDLILRTAVKHRLPQSELPAKLVIISDMEFDRCVYNASKTNFLSAKEKYEACGYQLPQIVFWNVQSRNCQQPVRRNEQGVALVSGVTPRIFYMVAGKIKDPYQLMMEILGSERYACIAA
ncbi:MAG: DUF2828 family protein [Eubacteriales bacterium]|nr:DUF2828 family protein [Eubacteriales bacterium]